MSSDCKVRVTVTFADPTLAGAPMREVARYYRPLIALHEDFLTSCFFTVVGDGEGEISLGVAYPAIIDLRVRAQIEDFFGKPISEILPVGKRLAFVNVQGSSLAVGQVESVVDG